MNDIKELEKTIREKYKLQYENLLLDLYNLASFKTNNIAEVRKEIFKELKKTLQKEVV